jgi:hypothetical protein
MNEKKLNNFFIFPFIILEKDRIVSFWLVTTILVGFFTNFSQLLRGETIEDSFQQGNIYIFSITLLITVLSDAIIYLLSEDKKSEANRKLRETNIENDKLLPVIGKTSITSYLYLIILFIFVMLITSLLLYSGKYRTSYFIQILIAVISIYGTFYYYCLNRLIQYPQNYEDYLETENKEIEILDKNNEEIKSFKNDTGKDVSI